MAYAVGIYSTASIGDDKVDELMKRLKGERTEMGWRLSRNQSSIDLQPAHHELPDDMPPEKIRAIAEELGGYPKSKLVAIWMKDSGDGFEFRMAKAVAKALSELFPIAFDDNAGSVEVIRPASIAGEN